MAGVDADHKELIVPNKEFITGRLVNWTLTDRIQRIVIPVAIAYIVAMLLLGTHLYHGVWSMFQSLGVSHPRYTPMLKRFAAGATAFVVAGNISIPISVMLGILR